MRRRQNLRILQQSFDERIVRLIKLLSAIAGTPQADRTIAYAAIEALNAWAIFSREYYLACAMFNARTINGGRSGPLTRFPDERAALESAIILLKPHLTAKVTSGAVIEPRDEPTWHETATIVRLGAAMAFQNLAQITSAFSYSTTFFRDCPPIRNFFAHRNKHTADKVANLVRSAPYYSTYTVAFEFLGSLLPGRPQTVLSDWLDDLRLVSHELCL